jgi:hypothetical protein
MWRRIHSNRDPRNTLWSEVSKEYNFYFSCISTIVQRLFAAHPKAFFGFMVVSMMVSLALSFTLFRSREADHKSPESKVNLVQDSFTQIMQTTENLRETLRLKGIVDSLSSKKVLNVHDSTLLDNTLDRLSNIHKTLK